MTLTVSLVKMINHVHIWRNADSTFGDAVTVLNSDAFVASRGHNRTAKWLIFEVYIYRTAAIWLPHKSQSNILNGLW